MKETLDHDTHSRPSLLFSLGQLFRLLGSIDDALALSATFGAHWVDIDD